MLLFSPRQAPTVPYASATAAVTVINDRMRVSLQCIDGEPTLRRDPSNQSLLLQEAAQFI